MIDPRQVADNVEHIRRRLERVGGTGVRLLPVTKGFGLDAVHAALEAGLSAIGESYAQELAEKAAAVGAPVEWHFIGRLQRNKVRRIAGSVALWQSVDRRRLGEEIARHAPGAAVLVQVNVTGEGQKGGCEPASTGALVRDLRDLGLDVRGLMAIGPVGAPEEARPGFRQLRALADDLELDERSMGMSGDLEVAVEEGSTMVRVGTALFGPRPQ